MSEVTAMRQGWFTDPECALTSYRRQGAVRILKLWGAEPSKRGHNDDCQRHPDNLSKVVFTFRDRIVCTCGLNFEGVNWPEWVTDEVLKAALKCADTLQTARGSWHKSEAWRNKVERERNK